MIIEVRVALIAASAQVLAATVALFGTLATGGSASADHATSAIPRIGASTVATPPAMGVSCTEVVEQYRRLVLLGPKELAALVTPGPDGISPVEADPDARRCGISAATLRAMQ